MALKLQRHSEVSFALGQAQCCFAKPVFGQEIGAGMAKRLEPVARRILAFSAVAGSGCFV